MSAPTEPLRKAAAHLVAWIDSGRPTDTELPAVLEKWLDELDKWADAVVAALREPVRESPRERHETRIALARMRLEHIRDCYLQHEKSPPVIDVDALADSLEDVLGFLGESVRGSSVSGGAPPPNKPTGEQIEAAARALWRMGNARIGERPWEPVATHYIEEATAALEAARDLSGAGPGTG